MAPKLFEPLVSGGFGHASHPAMIAAGGTLSHLDQEIIPSDIYSQVPTYLPTHCQTEFLKCHHVLKLYVNTMPEVKTLVGADLNSEVSSSSIFSFFFTFFKSCENSAGVDLELTSELKSTPSSPPANFSLFSLLFFA